MAKVDKLPISVIIHTRNSAAVIERAITSVPFATDVIVIDMESTDNSIAIAKRLGCRVFSHPDVGYVEPARNFGISKATQEWVLILDADEEILAPLAEKIAKLITLPVDVWKLPRKNLFFGLWPKHAAWWPDYVVRLFRHGHVTWTPEIHSEPKLSGVVDSVEAKEEWAITHHNYSNVSEYVNRLNHYTTIASNENHHKDQLSIEAFFNDFFRKFFYLKSYKDGVAGLQLSMLQAMYQASLAIKVWEKRGKKNSAFSIDRIMKKITRDLAYWRADYHVQNESSPLLRIYWRIRRKFKV
jgi:glycosyltransferase involved in cell wall biosynthesis